MQPKHSAIVAGLTLALSFGAVSAPAPAAAEEPTPGVASDATDIDKGLYTQQSFSGVLRSVQGVSFVNVTSEMKYFTKYESHGNYNQGFSYGDGYNALGYYQFDRRWSLIPFMKQAYNYNPEKYSMLKDAIDRGSEISNARNAMSENGQLTELGRIAQEAFQGAYNTDPAEFSALQDAYAYNSYYAVTEAWLKSGLGIDISGRADCVKGMVWSITNMCGTGGCQDFFRWANLSNSMTDREFVTALSNSVVNNVATKYASQPQYHEGWKNRYRNELKDCLVYIAEDEKNEAADKKPEVSEFPSTPDSSQTPEESQPPQKPGTDNNESNGGETNKPATGTGSNNTGSREPSTGSTGNDASKPSNGSSDSSAGGDFGTNTGSGSVTASGSDSSKDDSNKGTDAPVTPTNKKPSVSEVFGSTLGSLMAGPSGNSSSNKDNDGQNSVTKTDATQADSKDNKSEDTSEKPETDKGSGSEEKKDDSEEKGNKSGGGKNNGDRTDSAGDNKENTGDNKDGAGDNKDNNSGGKNDSGSGNGNAGNNGGIMPKTGDLIVMASLASASLATLGATSIVSGKHKLDQQKKAAGQNDSEE